MIQRLGSWIYQRRIPLICLLLSLAGLYQRWVSLAGRELWNDEIYELSVVSGPFKNVFGHHLYGDFSCFPGDYLITYPFIQLFGNHKVGIMIPHIILSIVGFVLLYALAKRYFRSAFAYAVTFALVAFNTNLVFHSFELRPYGAMAVLTLGAALSIDRLFAEFRSMAQFAKWLIALFLLFFVVFHVYGLIILFLLCLFQICYRYPRLDIRSMSPALIKYLLTMMVFFGCIWIWYAAPNLKFFGFQKLALVKPMPVFEWIPNPVMDLKGFLKAIVGNLIGCDYLKWTLLGFAAIAMPWNTNRFNQLGFLVVMVIVAIELVLLICLLNQYWFLQRQFAWVMPLFAFALGWLWDSFLSWRKS